MSWLAYSLLSVIIFALTNIFDSLIRRKYIKDTVLCTIIGASVSFLATSVVALAFGVTIPEPRFIIVALINGVFMVAAIMLYLQALSLEETSKVMILSQTSPLFVLLISFIVLREGLTADQLIAFCLIIAGSILASFKLGSRIAFSRGAPYAVGSAAVFAVTIFCWKYLSSLAMWTGLFWVTAGILFAAIPLMVANRKKLINTIPRLRKEAFVLLLTGAFIAIAARALFYAAIREGPIPLVSSIGGFQPLFVLMWSIPLGIFVHEVREKHDFKSLAQKVLAAAVMIAGVFLLNATGR